MPKVDWNWIKTRFEGSHSQYLSGAKKNARIDCISSSIEMAV